jgi:hypothetical protein
MPAPTSNTRGGNCVRDRPNDGSARTPSVRATAFTPARNYTSTLFAAKGELTSCSPCWQSHRRPWHNCARARRRARTQPDAHAGANVKHAWRRLREGPTHRRQRTHALSARNGIHPGANHTPTRFASIMGGTHKKLAAFPLPPPTVAELRPRTQARTHTGRRTRRRRRRTRAAATA